MSNVEKSISHGIFTQLRLLFAFTIMYTHAVRFIELGNKNEIISYLFGLKRGMGLGLGDFGVCGFFAISGYLIAGSWLRDPSIFNYAKNRVLRLYPGYVISSILCLTLFAYLAVPDFSRFLKELSPVHVLKQMLTFGGPSEPIFAGTHHPFANGSTWTIRLEVRMYILVAIFGIILKSPSKIKAVWWIVTGLALGLTVLPYGLPKESFLAQIILKEESFIRFLSCFSIGSLLRYYEKLPTKFNRIGLLCFTLFTCSLFFDKLIPFSLITLLPISIIAIGRSIWLEKLIPPMKMDLSYGVFLYAWPIQKLLIQYNPEWGTFIHLLVACPVTLIAAWVSWTFVEKPFIKLKSRAIYAKGSVKQ